MLRKVLDLLASFLGTLGFLHRAVFDAVRWMRIRYVWLKPRPTDIYIATFPKSGTTWMQQIVFQLLTRGQGEYQHILQVAPFVEELVMSPRVEPFLDGLASPRILKTHLLHWALNPPPDSRIIFVTRDAADTVVSRYQHTCLVTGMRLDFDRFVDQSVKEDAWSKHLASWWPHRNDKNVLHVRYAELVADREGCLRRIGAFLGVPVLDEDLPLLMEKTSFDYMKRNDARFDPRLALYELNDPSAGFIHKGGSGRGGAMMKPEHRAQLEARVQAVRQKLRVGPDEL
jgi:hypothetical protein